MILKYALHAMLLERIAAFLSSLWACLRRSASQLREPVGLAAAHCLCNIASSTGSDTPICIASRASGESPAPCSPLPTGHIRQIAARRMHAGAEARGGWNEAVWPSQRNPLARSSSTRAGAIASREPVKTPTSFSPDTAAQTFQRLHAFVPKCRAVDLEAHNR
jgi:hypothetical protein